MKGVKIGSQKVIPLVYGDYTFTPNVTAVGAAEITVVYDNPLEGRTLLVQTVVVSK